MQVEFCEVFEFVFSVCRVFVFFSAMFISAKLFTFQSLITRINPPVTCFTGHVPLIADGGIVVEFEHGEGPVATVGERLA